MQKRWTQDNLIKEDYEFAISGRRDSWDCLATRLWRRGTAIAERLALDMFMWEVWREVFEAPPFLAEPEHKERLHAALDSLGQKPAELGPLIEIPVERALALKKAIQIRSDDTSCSHRLILQGMSIHAFLIYRDQDTDTAVQQFRNWLVEHRSKPDPREWMPLLKKVSIRLSEGRKSIDAKLCALAVHRLKESGYSREQAEKALGLKRYSLDRPTNKWDKLPKTAKRLLRQLALVPMRFDGQPPFDPFKYSAT